MGHIWDPSGQPAYGQTHLGVGTHVEPHCTPNMGGPYGTHIGRLAGKDINIYLSIFQYVLSPEGGHQTGIPEYQVLRGLVETK